MKMKHLKEKDMEFIKEMLSGFSSSYLITKIMASLYYPFCDSANNSFSLLVFGRQLWQKVYHMLSFLSYKKFFSSSLIGSNASWKRNYQKFQETSLQKNGTHTHTHTKILPGTPTWQHKHPGTDYKYVFTNIHSYYAMNLANEQTW